MNLRTQLSGFTVILLMVLAASLTAVTVWSIKVKSARDIAQYETMQFDKVQDQLRDLVFLAVSVVQNTYDDLQEPSQWARYIREVHLAGDTTYSSWSDYELRRRFEDEARAVVQARVMSQLEMLKYDNGTGYFWVTDDTFPFPTMIMHAAKPQNNGKVMEDEKYNVEKNEGHNIYQYRVKLSKLKPDSAFVEYTMNKPGDDRTYYKMSYSYWYEPTGWVISTGIYMDHVYADIADFEARMEAELNATVRRLVYAALLLVVVGVVLAIRFGGQITGPMHEIRARLQELAKGHKVEPAKIERKDELGEMGESLNGVIEGINTYTKFARAIGDGLLEVPFKPLSDGDVLGSALLEMRDNLQQSQKQEEERSWAARGTAQFGTLFNQHRDDLDLLIDNTLRQMIRYLSANQGAFYLLQEAGTAKEHLERKAYFAYDRKKMPYQVIAPGEGLVGQCMLEKETLYVTEVPKDYVKINSGLGKSTPNCIVIFPIINNGVFYGVLEIAAFRNLAPYEVAFVEKVCELLAISLNTVKANQRTRELLVTSQSMSEELQAQEEELRQNQEELQATHEEMHRNLQESEANNATLKRKLGELQGENQKLRAQLLEANGQNSNVT